MHKRRLQEKCSPKCGVHTETPQRAQHGKGGVVEEGPGKPGRSQLTEVDGDGGSGACAVAEGREGAPRSVVSLPTQPGHEGTRDAHLPNA